MAVEGRKGLGRGVNFTHGEPSEPSEVAEKGSNPRLRSAGNVRMGKAIAMWCWVMAVYRPSRRLAVGARNHRRSCSQTEPISARIICQWRAPRAHIICQRACQRSAVLANRGFCSHYLPMARTDGKLRKISARSAWSAVTCARLLKSRRLVGVSIRGNPEQF